MLVRGVFRHQYVLKFKNVWNWSERGGGQHFSKSLKYPIGFCFFPKGGFIRFKIFLISCFPLIHRSPNLSWGGAERKLWNFFTFCDFFFRLFPKMYPNWRNIKPLHFWVTALLDWIIWVNRCISVRLASGWLASKLVKFHLQSRPTLLFTSKKSDFQWLKYGYNCNIYS